MDVDLHPERSILHAQVRKAKASHCVDEAGRFLRPSTFKGPSSKVYLGDVAETLLRCSTGAETPTFTQPPGFDEQRWIMEYTAGSIHVTIQSLPYWGFGLLTSGYRNEVIIRGPVEERARLVHDWVAALQHCLQDGVLSWPNHDAQIPKGCVARLQPNREPIALVPRQDLG